MMAALAQGQKTKVGCSFPRVVDAICPPLDIHPAAWDATHFLIDPGSS